MKKLGYKQSTAKGVFALRRDELQLPFAFGQRLGCLASVFFMMSLTPLEALRAFFSARGSQAVNNWTGVQRPSCCFVQFILL